MSQKYALKWNGVTVMTQKFKSQAKTLLEVKEEVLVCQTIWDCAETDSLESVNLLMLLIC